MLSTSWGTTGKGVRLSQYKSCCRCKAILPIDCFNKDKQTIDGLQRRCRICNRQVNQKDYQIHREKRLIKDAKYRKDNPDKTKAAIKRWANVNKQSLRNNTKKWNHNNPEYARQIKQIRRARKLANGIFKVSKKEIYKLYNSPCIYCGSLENIQIDHVIPIARGGTHGIGNLVSACMSCNTSKGKKFISEWVKRNPS